MLSIIGPQITLSRKICNLCWCGYNAHMNKDKVIKFFGGVRGTAKALNISTQAVYAWDDLMPEVKAIRAERLSKGRLKYNSRAYDALDS